MKNKSVWDTFVSTKTMAFLFVVFFLAIATATFIEHYYDTITSKKMVYHAWWFKAVMILLCINFIGNIKRYGLLRKEKWSILLIHIGMILTLVGAGITHYFGFEGIIRVKEGDITNTMWSAEPYLEFMVIDEKSGQSYRHPHLLEASEHLNNNFTINVDPFKKGNIKIEYVNYVSKVIAGPPKDSSAKGYNHIEVVFENMKSEFIPEGGYMEKAGEIITYNNPQPDAVNITGINEDLKIEFPDSLMRLSMETQIYDTLSGEAIPLAKRHLHIYKNLSLVYKGFRYKMERPLVKDDKGENLLTVKVTHNGETKEVGLWGGEKMIPPYEPFEVGGETIFMRFGSVEMKLPFSLQLDDFVLETYPGTDKHSGYKSIVTVYKSGTNPMNDLGMKDSIFMNNVLDYEGYRVFQSSYDTADGVEYSVFSVNNDYWGTLVTYIAYVMLSVGFIVTMFNKNSRFSELLKRLIKLNKKERNISAIIALLISFSSFSQESNYTPVSQEHCDMFNELLVLSYTERIQPCNSLAFDLIRKLTRKDSWYLEAENITLSPEQFLLDMFVDPGFWARQKVIKFDSRTGVGKEIGVEGNYLAFADIMSIEGENGQEFVKSKIFQKTGENGEEIFFTFDSLVQWAEKKPMGERNTFDKEIIKLDEKVVIFWQMTQGQLLRIIPRKFDGKEVWMSWLDPQAEIDLTDGQLGEDVKFTASILIRTYLNSLIKAKQTGDYSEADMVLSKIMEYQRAYFGEDSHLPSELKVKLEIAYNQWNVFNHLKYVYFLLGLILLPLTLIKSLSEVKKKGLDFWISIFIGIFIVSFLVHMANLGLRWYIIGHAPWSDGYEALTFIAWACILAGILFIRLSPIVTGATALLAFFILLTAGHNQYDPQMSDLEPVLKSYWLVIHVACLTVSYGFFGLGFILSLINMNIFAIRNVNSYKTSEKTIIVLTYVNEMTLTIGLVLATIGTFLGGVWANESWGRYWGWDAKETWALVIVLVYAFILHMRFVPGLRGNYALNLASGLGFSSVLFTFIGVNYYLTKGLHSYARGDAPAFPIWVWIIIVVILGLFTFAGIKERKNKQLLK